MAVIHIHAGLPKTGTSAIQRVLALNRARLGALGLSIPEVGLSAAGDHHALFWRLSGLPGQAGPDPEAFLAALPGARDAPVLISSELAPVWLRWGRAGGGLAQMRARGHRLIFHLFLRPQTGLLASLHPEIMRNLLISCRFAPFASAAMGELGDFARIARRIEAIEGAELRLLPFTDETRAEGPWRALLASLGLGTPEGLIDPGLINASPGPAGVAALAHVFARLAQEQPVARIGERLDLRRVALAESRGFPPEPELYWPYGPGAAAAIAADTATANDALARARLDRSWAALFAAEEAAAIARPRTPLPDARAEAVLSRAEPLEAALRERLAEIRAGRARRPLFKRLIGGGAERLAEATFRRALRRRLGD